MAKKKTEEKIEKVEESNASELGNERARGELSQVTRTRSQFTEEIAKVEDLPDEEALIEKPKEGLAVELGEVKELEEEIVEEIKKKGFFEKETWKPKTSLGMKVKNGEITSIDYFFIITFYKECIRIYRGMINRKRGYTNVFYSNRFPMFEKCPCYYFFFFRNKLKD